MGSPGRSAVAPTGAESVVLVREGEGAARERKRGREKDALFTESSLVLAEPCSDRHAGELAWISAARDTDGPVLERVQTIRVYQGVPGGDDKVVPGRADEEQEVSELAEILSFISYTL